MLLMLTHASPSRRVAALARTGLLRSRLPESRRLRRFGDRPGGVAAPHDDPPAVHGNGEEGDRHVASRTSRRGSGSDGCPRARVHRPADRRTAAGLVIAAATSFPSIERSEEHTSELQSLMRISYAVFCLQKKKEHTN